MKIRWLGRPRRLAFTTGEGANAKRHTHHVKAGDELDVPDGVTLGGEGVAWEKAKAKSSSKETS
jgi:hypothetical protein